MEGRIGRGSGGEGEGKIHNDGWGDGLVRNGGVGVTA